MLLCDLRFTVVFILLDCTGGNLLCFGGLDRLDFSFLLQLIQVQQNIIRSGEKKVGSKVDI
jgi:hypothetical protein